MIVAIILILVLAPFKIYDQQQVNIERLFEQIIKYTDDKYIVEGGCDYILKEESSIGLKEKSIKIKITNICIYSEERIFHEEVTRYIVLNLIEKRAKGDNTVFIYNVQWIMADRGLEKIEKKKRFSIIN